MIHQHAEEMPPGGALSMIKDGCLDGVDAIFASHLWSLTPLGEIDCFYKEALASSDKFTIEVYGKGGHGSSPHLTKDTVVIA